MRNSCRFSFRTVAYSILSVYFVITCYTGFHLLSRRLQTVDKTSNNEIIERIRSLSGISDDEKWNPWGEEFDSGQQLLHHQPPELWQIQRPLGKRSPLVSKDGNSSNEEYIVDIWGKAAIGSYLWEHIIGGVLEPRLQGVWSYGEKRVRPITFRYRTGPGVVPSKVPRSTEHLLLVLNGREPGKVEISKMWLESLSALPRLRNVGVVLLGNEACDNSWIYPYMHFRGGLVRFVMLVYDSKEIDDESFFQWPLGVATYRDFPLIDSLELPLDDKRPYVFNFLGTVYGNSSRQRLLGELQLPQYKGLGFVKPRLEWLPQETDQTREDFTTALAKSDLTLSPVGKNTECYRVYEAMAFGSIPVIEDIMTPGLCGDWSSPISSSSSSSAGRDNFGIRNNKQISSRNINHNGHPKFNFRNNNDNNDNNNNSDNNIRKSERVTAPLRLLKKYKAPVIFIKNWNKELGPLLKRESQLSHAEKAKRRKEMVEWYILFKAKMRDRLVSILVEKFFGHGTNR